MTDLSEHPRQAQVERDTRAWLERAVIGLNLCPFAKAVYVKGQIHFVVSTAGDARALLDDLARELRALEKELKSLRARCATPHSLSECGILTGIDRAAAAPLAPTRRRHVHGAH